jgi:hypothetical protein
MGALFYQQRRAQCVILAVALLCAPATSMARTTTADGDTQAVIIEPLGFIQVDDIEFGTIIAGPTASAVKIDTAGIRTVTGSATLAGGDVQPATFVGYGATNQFITITLGSTSSTMTRASGTETMTFGDFEIGSTSTAVSAGTPGSYQIISPTGIFEFPVGATLNVGPDQKRGDYAGTFSVTLIYN